MYCYHEDESSDRHENEVHALEYEQSRAGKNVDSRRSRMAYNRLEGGGEGVAASNEERVLGLSVKACSQDCDGAAWDVTYQNTIRVSAAWQRLEATEIDRQCHHNGRIKRGFTPVVNVIVAA